MALCAVESYDVGDSAFVRINVISGKPFYLTKITQKPKPHVTF